MDEWRFFDPGRIVGARDMSAGNGGAAGRGGYLLPSGYLSTRGNQIVDSAGNPVRLASVGWDGTLLADGVPNGLNVMSMQNAIANMKADGFNTIRIAWNDAMLNNNTMPWSPLINYTLNPTLRGLTCMQILDKAIQAAGAAGMKVILDHHTNEGKRGTVPTNQGHQANGLWFDLGPGSDGTDGAGNIGTVTAAKFQANWVTLATKYAGNSTVIGFDLHNEPGPAGNINWGKGGPTDLWAMATKTGNAIQKVNPGALIIVEGAMMGSGPGMPAAGPEGNLSGVAAKPVALGIANKVVYSVHEYPADISGRFLPPPLYVSQMNAAWGYLVAQNIAPVWVGEMGSSMDDGADWIWATTLLKYMNGGYAADGGPAFSGNQQPVSGDWWAWGNATGVANGTLLPDWKTFRPEVQMITDQMLFKPGTASGTPTSGTPSSSDVEALISAAIGRALQASQSGAMNFLAPAAASPMKAAEAPATLSSQATLSSTVSGTMQSTFFRPNENVLAPGTGAAGSGVSDQMAASLSQSLAIAMGTNLKMLFAPNHT